MRVDATLPMFREPACRCTHKALEPTLLSCSLRIDCEAQPSEPQAALDLSFPKVVMIDMMALGVACEAARHCQQESSIVAFKHSCVSGCLKAWRHAKQRNNFHQRTSNGQSDLKRLTQTVALQHLSAQGSLLLQLRLPSKWRFTKHDNVSKAGLCAGDARARALLVQSSKVSVDVAINQKIAGQLRSCTLVPST